MHEMLHGIKVEKDLRSYQGGEQNYAAAQQTLSRKGSDLNGDPTEQSNKEMS